jgi:NADPH:quinone reductase-like Zn-dependent oxidoreductase
MEYGIRIDPPAVMGFDVAGEVVETGPGVSNYKKGDRVLTRYLIAFDG